MNIYLLQNESRIILKEKIKTIVKKETNVFNCDYMNDGLEFILEEASYISLFDEKKYIIVKNANCFGSDKLNESLAKDLENYLNNPNSNTILIFTINEKVDERKKITKIIKEKYKLEIIPKFTPKELINRIIAEFKNNQMIITYDNAKIICDVALNNYDLIYNEINKILLFYNGTEKEVKEKDIINLISKNIEDNIFKFTDAVVKKDTRKMFQIFNDLKLIKEEPVLIINSLAREYRMLLKTAILIEKKYSKTQICKTLGLQDWLGEKVIQNSYNYRKDELKDRMKALSTLDISIKSAKIDKYLGIELFLLDV